MLDTGPLGRLCNPKPNIEIRNWLEKQLMSGNEILIPEIADYELRREFIRAGLSKSVNRLEQLEAQLEYVPITTEIIRHAAELWAACRARGTPTADPKELDGDVILAAQALKSNCTVITENIGHLDQLVKAQDWK